MPLAKKTPRAKKTPKNYLHSTPLFNLPLVKLSSVSMDVTTTSAGFISVSEMLLSYWKFAQTYYVKDGEPTSELEGMQRSGERHMARLWIHAVPRREEHHLGRRHPSAWTRLLAKHD